MAWFVLVVSGVLEAVWAAALDAAQASRRVSRFVLFLGALAVSMAGLAWAMRSLPTGTSYAVWVGIGATCTILWGFLTGKEAVDSGRIALLVLLVGSVIGLKVVS